MRKPVWLLLFLCIACNTKSNRQAIQVSLTHSGHAIKIVGLDPSISGEISRDTTSGLWETLAPVYKLPADTDLKNYQPLQHGKYILEDTAIIYTPDTPMKKGQAYFLRFYQFGDKGIKELIKGHKRAGENTYQDFLIRP